MQTIRFFKSVHCPSIVGEDAHAKNLRTIHINLYGWTGPQDEKRK